MEVLNKTQMVIDLIEENMVKNKMMEVDYEMIAKVTGTPIGLYQRIFTYICDISLASYIRKRKLTIAAEKILFNKRNITDVAYECGYENSASFTRAFKELFLVPPAMITEEIYQENAYQPISFTDNDTYYVLKGRKIMADIEKLDYEVTEDKLLIGISNKDYGVTTNELWSVYFGQEFDKKLAEMEENQIGMEDCIGLGYMTDFTSDTGLGDTYIIGKYFKMGTPIPEGMTGRIIRGGTIVRAQVAAKDIDDIISNSYILISNMVQKNGYVIDSDFYWVEFYTVSRYCDAIERGDKQVILDWEMPCTKL